MDRQQASRIRILWLSGVLLIALLAFFLDAIRLPVENQSWSKSDSTWALPDLRRELHDVSIIYGRFGGRCDDYMLAEMTARVAVGEGVEPKLLAALIAVESSCNPLAISRAGAIGLTQINVAVWAGEHGDWRGVNLFHEEQNAEIGARILRRMIERYGLWLGVERYCGQGAEARAYVARIRKVMEGRR